MAEREPFKPVKDVEGDIALVESVWNVVGLTCTVATDGGRDERATYLEFTPKRARKLAKRLMQAADEAEAS